MNRAGSGRRNVTFQDVEAAMDKLFAVVSDDDIEAYEDVRVALIDYLSVCLPGALLPPVTGRLEINGVTGVTKFVQDKK